MKTSAAAAYTLNWSMTSYQSRHGDKKDFLKSYLGIYCSSIQNLWYIETLAKMNCDIRRILHEAIISKFNISRHFGVSTHYIGHMFMQDAALITRFRRPSTVLFP